MRKRLEEMTYAEKVAAFAEGQGHLSAAALVSEHAAYVAQAEDFGMTANRCASNLVQKGNRRGF